MLQTHSKVLFKNMSNKDYKFYVSANIVILLNKHLQRRSKFSFLFIADSFIDLNKSVVSQPLMARICQIRICNAYKLSITASFMIFFTILHLLLSQRVATADMTIGLTTSRRPSQSPFIRYSIFYSDTQVR